jgi:hypothetical protein
LFLSMFCSLSCSYSLLEAALSFPLALDISFPKKS